MRNLLVLLLLFASLTSLNAQNQSGSVAGKAGLVLTGNYVKNKPKAKTKASKKNKNKNTVPKDYVGDTFEHLSLNLPSGRKLQIIYATDKRLVKQDEEFQLKVLFDESVEKIEVYSLGGYTLVAEATKSDIERRLFLATLKPLDCLAMYYMKVYSKQQPPKDYGFSVSVVPDGIYPEVKKQEADVIASGDRDLLNKFYRDVSTQMFLFWSDVKKADTYEGLSLMTMSGIPVDYKMLSDRTIVTPGDSVNLKIVFNTDVVSRVEVEGVGETSAEDIAKGLFIVRICPQKTTVYNVMFHKKDGTYAPMLGRVIVVSKEDYPAVHEKEMALKYGRGTQDELYQFYDMIAGGSIFELMKK